MTESTRNVNSQIEQILPLLPQEFQDWCKKKKLKGRDLRPLLSLTTTEPLNGSLLAIEKLRASKSIGLQILEWVIELHLLGKAELEPTDSERLEQWYIRLRNMRYPNSSGKEQALNHYVQKLKWPDKTRAKWVRQGDQSGLEVTLFTNSLKDFDKKMAAIRQKFSSLQSQEKDS